MSSDLFVESLKLLLDSSSLALMMNSKNEFNFRVIKSFSFSYYHRSISCVIFANDYAHAQMLAPISSLYS